ncbi:uncharacterized protein BXZ73DRAFT_39564 [Epithele typhae]|uniref:uncharacterized protein n=1 Tax=Epithele typhae TaxID=378194 RepID=UPI002007BBCA|nr:uncharacterized protein BXZ73DRAFT_39564 [Epithele typhae]KAH9944217.1 hypothetical protein BXZ73DRAFT_39564 [Epithele typhae]
MPPIQFKLTHPPDGLVRRITFQERPSWDTLASRIQDLYKIPIPSVAVSYLDSDGDEVTLSTEEELQDFYQSTVMQKHDGTLNLVKFTVRDLDSLHADKPLPQTPRTTSGMNYRNTFGRSATAVFEMEVDDGWQSVPNGMAGLFGSGPHAFVEVLDSDADVSQIRDKHVGDSAASSTTGSTGTLPEIIPTPSLKGKARANSDDFSSRSPDTISSTQSLVAEEAGSKHTIHINDFSTRGYSCRSTLSALVPRPPTPKVNTAVSQAHDDDPPLPDLGSTQSAPPNVANDVADLFGMLASMLASNPELSEGIRNIVRNASNGTYWATHREQVTRAAEEIRRSALVNAEELRQTATDGRRAAEEAAGRRVAEALSNVIRVISDITGVAGAAPQPTEWADDVFGPRQGPPPPFGSQHGWGRRHHRHHHHGHSWDDTVPILPPPPHPNVDGLGAEDAEVTMYGASPPVAAPDAPEAAVSAPIPAPDSSSMPVQQPEIISNARGPFPQLQLFSVPRRSHTIHAPVHRRDGLWGTFESAGPSTQLGRNDAADSLIRRLSDMGFTSANYPSLNAKIDARLSRSGEAKANEDTIVSDLVDELLELPPLRDASGPSGSGMRHD